MWKQNKLFCIKVRFLSAWEKLPKEGSKLTERKNFNVGIKDLKVMGPKRKICDQIMSV